ncbi:glycosyltransferase [Rhodobacteraceae bacterium 2376]|uniref:Glycosyltransferase n=1 Tax=Rhabdonatronobacter sediminivivens TaxID=2743469 RepID=A0A7Z0KVL5_9RHOB|nr:glycosyltransferase [Rhabdonatronobacter sediminivivens]NYS23587.1 glycosyltransferase [Rhabdonatronobacter sediminivivens]
MTGGLSILIPASNEGPWIGACLSALAQSSPAPDGPVQVIVIANGCQDDTAAKARASAPQIQARGWQLEVLELAQGSKPAALNAGDAAARHPARLYLDADVRPEPALLAQISQSLCSAEPRYVTGTPRIAPPRSAATRLYARAWSMVPFNQSAAPGYGLFAVTATGRARWQDWPDIISDDTFARLQFAPSERIQLPAQYDWPLPEGLRPLIRVRARQDRGVRQIAERYPHLPGQDHKSRTRLTTLFRAAPLGTLVYAAVILLARLQGASGWARGR